MRKTNLFDSCLPFKTLRIVIVYKINLCNLGIIV